MARRADVVDAIEACYRFDLDEEAWLRGIVAAGLPLVDKGLFVGAYTFDVSNPSALRILRAHFEPDVDISALGGYLGSLPPDFVRDVWLGVPCGYAATLDGFEGPVADGLAQFGARDVCAIAGNDPTGHGVWLGSVLARRGRSTPEKLTRFGRISAHLAASYRYRRKLERVPSSRDEGEAVLSPDGRLEHAEGPAKDAEARAELRRAVVALDHARSKAGHADPDAAVASWKGLVSARWTLVDRFESDGRRFVVAAQNDPQVPASRALSAREQQILAHAAMGHDNKTIAYELGLSASTVRVLMSRATKKLGVRTRPEAVARFRNGK